MNPFVRTLAVTGLVAAGLVAVDGALASAERQETAQSAERFNETGQQLMRESKFVDASEAFRSAIASARENNEYPLALGQALLDAGRLDEAASTLTDLLNANAMGGAPNLAMARVLARQHRTAEAAFYYHRAIYGQWTENAQTNRTAARFELADLLARDGSKAELLAELIPLQELAPGLDVLTQTHLARLYLTAGSPARAAAIYRDLTHAQPTDADLRTGLADASLASGNYIAAQQNYLTALRLRAGDPSAQKGLDSTNAVLNLDPSLHGLSGGERYDRSLRLMQMATARVTQCTALKDDKSAVALLADVDSRTQMPVTVLRQNEAAETNVDLANKLWQAVKTACPTAITTADQPLELVLARAAQ